ncbi:beta-galactosidase [Paraoerskovia marina]|uniref:Beta-galactosidase n=1 Tax=Paraoerskovia marina TaxID=545619 RepID=A0A1H1NFK5_9CELL|nr:beta-galactosidase [Paraoerskovia marina]SDR97753.1 beta-galactosidase [Paraoerskovia marina]
MDDPAAQGRGLPLPHRGIAFGGDYNPEQWTRETWAEDVRLMNEAGVDLVAINIFGWAEIERTPGNYDFGRLDEVMDLLAAHDISVNLGTGTSSPPPWLTTAHPEVLPVTRDGVTVSPGGRQAWCPSSPVVREHALNLVRAVAERYAEHPALVLWHVSNELGCHNALCFCDESARAFRRWLADRYGSVDALNDAWGTAFWSQRYGSFDEVLPPRVTASSGNPTQELDYRRFSSDELLAWYDAEAEVLRELSVAPVTTNFMATAHIRTQDYWSWAGHVDVVANDHYVDHRLADPAGEVAFAADLTRGLARGNPWMLMETSTGAVNWQPRNIAKVPGELERTVLTHVSRGADAVCFFQWRASRAGSERFHSALLPHAGTDSQQWRTTTRLGALLDALDEVAGSTVVAEAALVFDWQAWWACDGEGHPTADVRYLDEVHALHGALRRAGVTVDVVPPGAVLDDYRLVVVPTLYAVDDEAARSLEGYVGRGGHVLVTYSSGLVDENDHVRLGGYPGAFRELLGVRSDEVFPLEAEQIVTLDDGSHGSVWTERLEARGARVVASYVDGPLPGTPALTRHEFGHGVSWYLATRLDEAGRDALIARILADADVRPVLRDAPASVDAVRRRGSADYVFVMNHGDEPYVADVPGRELTTDTLDDSHVVPAGGVAVVRQETHGRRPTQEEDA